MHRGKNYLASVNTYDKQNQYEPDEALKLVIQNAKAKFDETVELHIRLGVDSRHADQQVRGAVVLPHGTGKTTRVLVFARDAKAAEALEAGADLVGAEDMVQKIQKENFFEFINRLETRDRVFYMTAWEVTNGAPEKPISIDGVPTRQFLDSMVNYDYVIREHHDMSREVIFVSGIAYYFLQNARLIDRIRYYNKFCTV